MNNETNRDAEAFERHFLDWILQAPIPNASSEDRENLSEPPPSEEWDDTEENSGVEYWEWDEPDPLYYQAGAHNAPAQPLTIGEIPTVQDRFQTLLKERLRAEIESNPPLFPWETELKSYDYDYPDDAVPQWVPPLHLWTPQLQNIRWGRLPIPIAQGVFAQLLEPCQELVMSSLREGSKLVRAVNSLFPGQSEELNQLAGFVLRGATRGITGLEVEDLPNYSEATTDQQMLMSLLAAREIIESLTLNCPVNQPPVSREWLTALGSLNLQAQYLSNRNTEPPRPCLRVECEFPGGGSLELKGGDAEATAQRPNSGHLSVELFDPQPDKTYALEVKFQNFDARPLMFAIRPTLAG
ncbi:hypothetical protein [Tychonema sp. LEGE 07203]|uniref:hypothetical protein n=1 Tax=Tychonema sp. LEGE 07203 TaxID=1828671 RepID=UPI0018811010|nr:hypothetical protein [Tychonema sp. LEGE 07203]MBE9093456.1 hypothetical protein [Tychonema sp. LEGE 07203]